MSNKLTVEELIQMGFSFNYGYINLINPQNDSLYTNIIEVIEYKLYYNINKPYIPVKIIKKNE